MKIKLVKDLGFCWGVRRALDLALKSSHPVRHIYTYGPLIHNKNVVQTLQARGIRTLSAGIKRQGKRISLVIRAHGVSPSVRDRLIKNGYKLIDATCPHVMKSQKMVKEYANKGWKIIIAGDKEHAEVISLIGYAQAKKFHSKAIVISSLKEAGLLVKSNLLDKVEKICLLAQSTFQPQLYQQIVHKLQSKLPAGIELVVLNTICHAPARRQDQVKELAREVDAFVVVGDHKSANTTNLTLLARSLKIPAFQVASVSELPLERLKRFKSIGITTGTSTPDSVIEEVIERIARL